MSRHEKESVDVCMHACLRVCLCVGRERERDWCGSVVLWSGAQLPTELQQVNLSGVDLSKRDLSRHNLTGANLTGANLTGANLTGANLTNANVSGSLFVVRWCRVALVRCLLIAGRLVLVLKLVIVVIVVGG